MKKKIFTEEQYQKIVIAYDKLLLQEDVDFGLLDGGSNSSESLYEILEEDTCDFGVIVDNYEKAIAIANPLTREEAKDKYVEKEKKYFWRSKKKDNCDIRLHLNMNKYDSVEASYNRVTPLTETEIREWGYNPDYYDKEEVD
ncbi:hypothetical protein H7198_01785 [Fructobacillus sp. CRL 2054]|uniref:hypothetical protein n=1 Tax=Fructobacillus sp. CRL 2054 TaxID=2763007 RepID=UPI0023787AA4|nr:hypothetical protein [Fructobacillus sp. CRL 2054]MDD9138344.1 hypothetical protein [Fructobacillus sp. CRL 2054]